jgi:hypothetical protein
MWCFPLSDELLRREELDDLDAAVSLVLDDLTRAAGGLVANDATCDGALARPTCAGSMPASAT